jgi:hypothetical protein
VPYFLILPAFLLYVFAISAFIVFTFLYRPAAYLRRFAGSVLIWSTVGFVASTAVYVVVLIASARVFDQIVDGKTSVAGGVMMGGMVFIVPFVAAAAGLIGGAVFGLWRSLRKSGRSV